LAEETGLRDIPLEQLRAFGKPGRDPRGRTVTIAYLGVAGENWQQAKGADDAAQARWFDVECLPVLAFDHEEIVRCAIERLQQADAQGTRECP
jgi:8-oxo-dGTP diphosphatase